MWAGLLPSWAAIVPVDLPGRERRFTEPAFTRLGSLVSELAEAVASDIERPYVLVGHSMGGLLAFEVARELRRTGRPEPDGICIAATPAPAHRSKHQRRDWSREEFIADLARLRGVPVEESVGSQLFDVMSATFHADFELLDTYTFRTESPLRCPFLVLGGRSDEIASQEQLEAWESETTGQFSVSMFPGGHFFLHEHEGAVAAELESWLRKQTWRES
jgi:surfactin synthase thioesterase subunit